LSIDNDDRLGHRYGNAGPNEAPRNATPPTSQAEEDPVLDLPPISSNNLELVELPSVSIDHEAYIDDRKSEIEPRMPKSWWDKATDTIIEFVYKISTDYTDLYTTDSQAELVRHKVADGSKWWIFFRGVFYAVCAVSICFFYTVY
jgi:hypothetical protein